MHDLVITGALVVDGTGAPAYRAAVAVDGERITAIQKDDDGRPAPEARELLDASGLVLAPGFIDLHSHADFTLQGAPVAETQLAQGVTTVLAGNCGSSPFPVKDMADLRREHAHLDPAFTGEWTDTAGFLAATEAARPGVNIAVQIGLSSLRSHVVGGADRPATAEELEQMKELVRQAGTDGARGFSSGLIYVPGSYAGTDEVTELARVAAECGLIYSTHMRNESGQLLEAVQEALATAEASGVRLEISHLKAMGPENHGKTAQALELIEQAQARGVDVSADVYPYTASSTTLTSRLPGWAMDGGKPALLERLADAESRGRIDEALSARFGRDVDPDGVIIADLGPAIGEDMGWTVGLSLSEIGEREGCGAGEAALRVIERHGAAVAIVNHAMAEEDLRGVLRHPAVSVASDGWTMTAKGPGRPHPRSFGTFVRVLGKYVREERVLTLEEAVRKMSGFPASRLGLDDRGVVREGAFADLCLFDPENVQERATFEEPWQLATGVHHVLVGGRFAWRDGALTAERCGQVI